MAFTLGLTSCQNNNCKRVVFTDASTDPDGTAGNTWDDGTNPNMADVTEALLTIGSNTDTTTEYELDIVGFFVYGYIGRCTGVSGGTTITGDGTSFTTTVAVGNTVGFGDLTSTYVVSAVVSDTELTLASALSDDVDYEWGFNLNTTPTASDLIFDVVAQDLGLAEDAVIPDDSYNILYEVYDDSTGVWYVYETNILLYCNVECCVYSKLQAIPQYYKCDNCDSTYIDNALLAFAFLESLKAAARCGSSDNLVDILDTLKKLCNYQACAGCK